MTWSTAHLAQIERAAAVATAHTDTADARPAGTATTGLADALYAGWYAAPQEPVEEPPRWSAPLPAVLRAAHAGSRRWSGPWPVVGTGVAGAAVVAHPAGRRAVGRGEYRTLGAGAGRAPTRTGRLRVVQRRGGHLVDDWWRTWSDDWQPADPPVGLSRIYLAPSLADLALLVSTVTGHLVGRDHPWLLKIGADPATLARADGAVLYLPDGAVGQVGQRLAVACAGLVRTATPPLTHPLTPGIAWAQDPGDGTSYGEAVVALVARAWTDRVDGEAWPATLSRTFLAAGRDPAAPHRGRVLETAS